MAEPRRVRVLFNEHSGAGSVSSARIAGKFAERGCACEVTPLSAHLDLAALAARDQPAVVWMVAGGDGSVNAVAAACAGGERAIGVLPVGTFNHFARDLGIPQRLDDAIAFAAQGIPRLVDAAEVNGLVFVNNSSLGMYAAMVLDRDRLRKNGAGKWWAMVKASARAFARFRCLEVELEAGGTVRRLRTALLFIGNNRYEKEAGRVGRRERLDEGVLSVALVVGATRWGMLKVLTAALAGRSKKVGELEEFLVESFRVKAHGRRRLRVALDGEVKRMRGPLEYKVRPAALHVIAPETEAS